MSNPAAALAHDEQIAAQLEQTRAAIDALLWRRDVRAEAEQVAAESVRVGARDSAAIEGADQVGVDDSPMGRVVGAAVAVTAESLRQDEVWARAPAQALARLHAVAAHGFVADDELGRPRHTDAVDDPLHIGNVPSAQVIVPRLNVLIDVVTKPGLPALLEAGIVHGELMALRPFTWGSGLVARASVRMIARARGLDPSSFVAPERGMFELGRAAYVQAIRQFQQGTPDGLRAYMQWFTQAVQRGI
jgi:hypothetical protein